ncbi:MAG: hypothetical protein WBF79_17105 [Rhodococcus sp. (in: high G+C Gram-positive bacteria)]
MTDLTCAHARSAPAMVGAGRVGPGRVAALLALASAIAHLTDIAGHGVRATGIGHIVIMIVMSAACCACAWHLWCHPRVRDWALVAVMSVAMIAMHLTMNSTDTHGGHHRPTPAPVSESQNAGSVVPLVFALIEALFSTAILFAVTRTSRDLFDDIGRSPIAEAD